MSEFYDGHLCDELIDYCTFDKAIKDSLSSSMCAHDSKCQNVFGGKVCHCDEIHWRGAQCELDVDECKEEMPCENGAECQNLNGSFECHCPKFYFGIFLRKKKDKL